MTQQQEDNKPKPALLTEQLIDEVCAYLAEGRSQSSFCRDKGFSQSTWNGWLRAGKKAAIKDVDVADESQLALRIKLYKRIEQAKLTAPPKTNPNGGRKPIDLFPHAEKIATARSQRIPLHVVAGLVGVCPDTLSLWLKSGEDLLKKKAKDEEILPSEEKYLDFIEIYNRVLAEKTQEIVDKAQRILLEPRIAVQQRFLPQQQDKNEHETTDGFETKLVLAERLENEMPPNPSVALRFLESLVGRSENANKSAKKSQNLAIFNVPSEIEDIFYEKLATHERAHVIEEAAQVYEECLILAQQVFESQQEDEG